MQEHKEFLAQLLAQKEFNDVVILVSEALGVFFDELERETIDKLRKADPRDIDGVMYYKARLDVLNEIRELSLGAVRERPYIIKNLMEVTKTAR